MAFKQFTDWRHYTNMTTNKTAFKQFIALFPEVTLPLTLGEDTHLTFSRKNEPFSQTTLKAFIEPLEEEVFDDFTEALPCFRLPVDKGFHAIVYWKAKLMNYQYILATFDEWGQLIDKKTIAGTFSDGSQLTQSVATINDKWQIYIASGQSDAVSEKYVAAETSVQRMSLTEEGEIKIQE